MFQNMRDIAKYVSNLKICELSQNLNCSVGDVKRGSYLGLQNIRRHRINFSCYSDLTPGICAPLIKVQWYPCMIKYTLGSKYRKKIDIGITLLLYQVLYILSSLRIFCVDILSSLFISRLFQTTYLVFIKNNYFYSYCCAHIITKLLL